MADKIILTQKGYNDLQHELDYLRATKRHEVAEKIKIAREFGDLSENAEYDAAKEEQAQVEGKIFEIEQQLINAEIIDEASRVKGVVSLGMYVTITKLGTTDKVEYRIVGITETDVTKRWISNASPIGSALMGKKVGDIIDVKVPSGMVKFKIVTISDKE